jgi:hypothetical protein
VGDRNEWRSVIAELKEEYPGAAQTLAKPFNRGDLLNAVADLLGSPTR